MGLDVVRFRGGAVDEELICPICTGVLEAPLQAPVSNTLLQNNSIFFTPWYKCVITIRNMVKCHFNFIGLRARILRCLYKGMDK